MKQEIIRLGGMYGQATRWGVYDKQGIAPTLTASMGCGGGFIPMVIEDEQDNQDRQIHRTLE